ncbi:methyltransferase [Mycobacterium barrassiae]|uniref:HemK2/MTQ2 family protein methyltransferase n=1 Tax=Mycobacterium barrassiae TaxID=319709 RepID=UPI0022659D98|nr:HemK2/MTQ2 family protein methyltransferase [Mycobacterium barrassiae]MCV7303501.1 methyltransferase [Mycobacterium barrassiae]
MTTAYTDADNVIASAGVYAPQEDTQFLVDVIEKTGLAVGRRVADLCTGSGAVAIAAAEQGALQVTAFDVCPRSVRCARMNALRAGVDLDVRLGSWARAAEFGPFDLIVSNPPYVPHDPDAGCAPLSADVGPARAWDAGRDGRLVLDPMCAEVPDLLAPGGTFLVVHSEFAVPRQTLAALAEAGLDAEIVAYQWIPFGPVLTSRAGWLEETGRLEPGRREEELVVIRAERP